MESAVNALRRPTLGSVSDARGIVGVLSAFYDAIVALRQPVPVQTFASVVVSGRNGIGYIEASPFVGSDGSILQRFTAGSRVMAVVNLTSNVAALGAFESVISQTDLIKQTVNANLTGSVFSILVAN